MLEALWRGISQVIQSPYSYRIMASHYKRALARQPNNAMSKVPTFDQLMNPLIIALRDLGGSGSIDEIYERVIQNLQLSEDVLSVLHDPEVSNQTEQTYRLAWPRTYLKKYVTITNSSLGIC